MQPFGVEGNNAPWSQHTRCSWSKPKKQENGEMTCGVCFHKCNKIVTFCHNYLRRGECNREEIDGACSKGWHWKALVTSCPITKFGGICPEGCTPTWTMCHEKNQGKCHKKGVNCEQGWHISKDEYLIKLKEGPPRKKARNSDEGDQEAAPP